MYLMDVVTHEMDHQPNNYFVIFDDSEKAIDVSIFDNNGAGTFCMKSEISFSDYKNCSEFLNSDGTVNRPFLPLETVNALKKISPLKLYKSLHRYLSIAHIIFTWIRIKKVKKAIKKTVRERKDFLITTEQWNADTIKEELSGKYGKTYLISYLEDCCVPYCDVEKEV